jgi:type II secretion system protein I
VNRRGSILLEVLLAIAVFVFAGVVILGVMQETVAAGGRAERRALAMDMARTRMAELESGVEEDASAEADSDASRAPADPRRGLRVESRTEPSEFEGLELAVVEVWDDAAPAPTAIAEAFASSSSPDPPRLAVLRQLVRLPEVPGARR